MTNFTGMPEIDEELNEAEVKTCKRGNPLRATFLENCDRYRFDNGLDRSEWKGFDTSQDAWYYGVWVNKMKLSTLSYVEGDLYHTQLADASAFDAEISDMCQHHDPIKEFTVIENGVATDCYQDRREFFINPPGSDEGEEDESHS